MCTCTGGIDTAHSDGDQVTYCLSCQTGLRLALRQAESQIAKVEQALDGLPGGEVWQTAYRESLVQNLGRLKDLRELYTRKLRQVRADDLHKARLAEQATWAARVLARKHNMTLGEVASWFEHDLPEVEDGAARERVAAIANAARVLGSA